MAKIPQILLISLSVGAAVGLAASALVVMGLSSAVRPWHVGIISGVIIPLVLGRLGLLKRPV